MFSLKVTFQHTLIFPNNLAIRVPFQGLNSSFEFEIFFFFFNDIAELFVDGCSALEFHKKSVKCLDSKTTSHLETP